MISFIYYVLHVLHFLLLVRRPWFWCCYTDAAHGTCADYVTCSTARRHTLALLATDIADSELPYTTVSDVITASPYHSLSLNGQQFLRCSISDVQETNLLLGIMTEHTLDSKFGHKRAKWWHFPESQHSTWLTSQSTEGSSVLTLEIACRTEQYTNYLNLARVCNEFLLKPRWHD
jgi:hypothetical protein